MASFGSWTPATAVTLTPSSPSPHVAGSNVQFIASASGATTTAPTVNFTLKTPGVTVALPASDPSPVVGKMTPGPTVSYQNGFKTNFSTAFH